MYTTINYQYTDASNYKQFGAIVLDGALTDQEAADIAATLDSQENFIPWDLQLGIAELQSRMTSYPSEDDHVWHTLHLAQREVSETVPEGTATIDARDLVKAFAAVKAKGWDVVGAVERLCLW
jgi:hypothetical protein